MSLAITRLDSLDADFDVRLESLLAFETEEDAQIDRTVSEIIADVRKRKDAAVLDYTNRFDFRSATSLSELEVSPHEFHLALDSLDDARRNALKTAADRIRSYHIRQFSTSEAATFSYVDEYGSLLGQRVTPIDRVGIYVPGGKAAYPSSVLMNAIPAQVAGVGEIIMVVPKPHGLRNDLVLAAAALCGVDRMYTIGGAQAIAALAYGTETIGAVDKIVGPGNAYVAAAKRRVFGQVGIDMIAGPSEILVLSDGTTDPDWIAMDLFSQAEHDEMAQAILVCPDGAFLDRVMESVLRLLPGMDRQEIIRASLAGRAAFIRARDMEEACSIANRIAPEHLEISTENPEEWLKLIRHAGAIFLGPYTSEALGDYCAGPNHVLPTSRTARFSSPLGVYDFQKRSSFVQASREGAHILGEVAMELALGEGLDAHAKSAAFRLKSPPGGRSL